MFQSLSRRMWFAVSPVAAFVLAANAWAAPPSAPQQDLKLFKPKANAAAPKQPAPKLAPNAPTSKAATDAPAKAPATKQGSADKPAASIVIDESVSPQEFWDAQFANQHSDPATVRQAARDLLEARKLDHVIALCQAALRSGQPQPWMYEMLGLALEARAQPKEEIERVMMSAVDFAQSSDQLMYVAQYLSRVGLDARALQVYRQVVARDPLRYDAYAQALKIASDKLSDLDGIKWATVGVLSQAWPSDQVEVYNTAARIAKATVEQLKKENRTDELKSYQAKLDTANIRDCVVQISWTGQADIDLLVEEPTGTVCSLRNPRTTSGGAMLGDAYARSGKGSSTGSSEAYVCPEGFAGTYRLVLRRVWGRPTAGKVTVDVYTNCGTPEGKHERQQIAVGERDAGVVFEIKQARRREPLKEQQVAQAAAGQLAVGRAILAQQLANVSDPNVAAAIAQRRGLLPGQNPFGQGAVGFQPVIIVLPEGTNFGVTGVISADRRYVRITAMPIFSGIGDVSTFTFAGASTTGGNTNPVAGGG